MLVKRAAIAPAAREEAGRKILAALMSLPEYLSAKTIFCYVSAGDEPDTRALIEDARAGGRRVGVPRCASAGEMRVHEIRSSDDLAPGIYDIPEPKEHCPHLLPGEVDLVIVPCVCCDEEGYRLGYGGGFYDRWLEKHRAPAAALCYESMVVPAVPREPHDRRVGILVTDETVRVF
jgi:5-formyltetrahydrofolate cyclo-ligase